MVTTVAYFEDIRKAIQKELLLAENTVYAAIAWFTDRILFNTLLELQKKGVQVQICVIQDDINFAYGNLPFQDLNNDFGKFYAMPDDKMHHKFCVIDESVVITGSYNWTNRAANAGKNENIIVTCGDKDLAQQFVTEFFKISNRHSVTVLEVDISKLIMRCNALLQLIQLGEKEDIYKQAKRLQTEAKGVEAVQGIATLLLQNNFTIAVEKINSFLLLNLGLQIYRDSQADKLKFDIKLLEYQIIAVENEKAEVEKIIYEYDRLYNEILGETIKQYLFLKTSLAKYLKKHQPANEDFKRDYYEAERDYESYTQSYEHTKRLNKNYQHLNDADKILLNKMYREASMLCHPDKFEDDPEKYAKANIIFQALNDANRNQEIEKVKYLLQQLRNGFFDLKKSDVVKDDIVKLEEQLSHLEQKYKELLTEISNIKNNQAYLTGKEKKDLSDYFYERKKEINIESEDLLQKINEYEEKTD